MGCWEATGAMAVAATGDMAVAATGDMAAGAVAARLADGELGGAAVQVAALFVYSACAWKLGWTFAPADVSAYRMLATNYQPGFQKNSALVAEELRALAQERPHSLDLVGGTGLYL